MDSKTTTTKPITTVAIIGTAGRKDDGPKMNAQLFEMMCKKAKSIITEEWKLQPSSVRLVSGGAAWSDHVAVRLYLDSLLSDTPFAGLIVYLPCGFSFDSVKPCAVEATDKSTHWAQNPGRLMNMLHYPFAQKLNLHSHATLQDIVAARSMGAVVDTSSKGGFHARNALVARAASRMIAFTWGTGDIPKDGGTKHAWDLFRISSSPPSSFKLHIPLNTLATSTIAYTKK
jgi:hypothetical protein